MDFQVLYPLEVTTDDKRNTGSLSGGKEIDAAIRFLDLGGHTGQHGDRELKTLRAVDGHDPHTVVVGLRQHRFRYPGVVGTLKAGQRR